MNVLLLIYFFHSVLRMPCHRLHCVMIWNFNRLQRSRRSLLLIINDIFLSAFLNQFHGCTIQFIRDILYFGYCKRIIIASVYITFHPNTPEKYALFFEMKKIHREREWEWARKKVEWRKKNQKPKKIKQQRIYRPHNFRALKRSWKSVITLIVCVR